jgi:hypothetical protein
MDTRLAILARVVLRVEVAGENARQAARVPLFGGAPWLPAFAEASAGRPAFAQASAGRPTFRLRADSPAFAEVEITRKSLRLPRCMLTASQRHEADRTKKSVPELPFTRLAPTVG